MGIFRKIIDWAADEVQKTTGEKERRAHISELKRLARKFYEVVQAAIEELNKMIDRFNQSVKSLNSLRQTTVKTNVDALHSFLNQFGQCKDIGYYTDEEEAFYHAFPQKDFEQIENYIKDVDWSEDVVFWETFLRSPVGMRVFTRRQNLSLQEHIHEFGLLTDETVRELNLKTFSTEREIKICELYQANVSFISKFISERIVPELELVEAFFQAESIKNEIIADHTLSDIRFTYNPEGLVGTAYERHYRFIKNAFLFYVISCKIYNTPVLTNLLRGQTSENDILQLEAESNLLEEQSANVENSSMITRRR